MKKLSVFLCMLLVIPVLVFAWGEQEDVGTITGRLFQKNGRPLANATVFLFDASSGPPPTLGKYWRVPDVIASTDDGGTFTMQARQGRYYLGAIKRMSEMNPVGPPSTGDYVYPSHEDETKGKLKAYRIVKWESTNIGSIKGIIPFDSAKHLYRGPVSAIEGTIRLPDGKSAEDAIVFAYDNPDMAGNPRFVSDPAGKDGKYILRLGKPGTYYLRVRGVYGGGMPAQGSIMGSGIPSGVTVSAGKTVKGIDITGYAFEKNREKGNESGQDDSQPTRDIPRGSGVSRGK